MGNPLYKKQQPAWQSREKERKAEQENLQKQNAATLSLK
jgi:hypothetical protein